MSSTPPEAPVEPGPRVTRDEIRDLGRLRRTRNERKIAGVAGGLARHFDIDPIIPRVALVVLVLFGGAGLLIYGVCWLIVPWEDSQEATVRLDERNRTIALVIVAILAGLALLGDSLGGWGFPWPLVIVGAIVLAVMAMRNGRDAAWSPPPVPGSEPESTPKSTPESTPESAATSDHTYSYNYTYAYTPPPRRAGPALFWYAVLLIAIGCGVLGMIDLAGADIADGAYPALALAICGVTLVVGAFWGRAGGIILLGLISAVATGAATVVDRVDTGHIDARPLTVSAVESDYELGAGEIELDLTNVADLANLDGRTIELEVDLGRIAVTVPEGLDVRVEADVDIGDRSVFGDDDGSQGTTTIDGGIDAPFLELEVSVGIGEIEIIREGDN